jgi:mutator protein MutT
MTIVVTAAVIERDGRWLVTRRPKGAHLEGLWEFPGGKCHAGEPLEACLARELREELGVDSDVGTQIFATTHSYLEPSSELHVELHFFECHLLADPLPQLDQEMRWVPRDELRTLAFPPADATFIAQLTADAEMAQPGSLRQKGAL